MAARNTQTKRGAEKLSAVAKALRVLEVVARSGAPISMTDIERQSGLSRPTAHRVVSSLIDMGYIERDGHQRQHSEGSRLMALALDVVRSGGPRTRRRAVLAGLTHETGETSQFALLHGSEVLLVDWFGSSAPLAVRYDGMERMPAHCTACGKLLLALLADGQREAAVAALPLSRHTERTIVDRRRLIASLADIRSAGHASEDGEHLAGVCGLALPVLAADGSVLGAIGLSGPQARLGALPLQRHLPLMRAAATRLATITATPLPAASA